METVNRSVLVRGWGEGWIKSQNLGFGGQYNSLYDTVMGIHLSKPIKCTTLRVNLNVNYGLGVIIVCHYTYVPHGRGC